MLAPSQSGGNQEGAERSRTEEGIGSLRKDLEENQKALRLHGTYGRKYFKRSLDNQRPHRAFGGRRGR